MELENIVVNMVYIKVWEGMYIILLLLFLKMFIVVDFIIDVIIY